jgi:hypothetical protein
MRKLFLIAFSASLLLLTSCITIFEKFKINADGSGTLEYIIDMSEMYEMMAAFSDSTEEMDMSGFDESMREALPGLSEISGIKNIGLTGNPAKFIAGIKFDFDNSDALNKAMAVLFMNEEYTTGDARYVEIKGKNFTRFGLTSKDFNKEALLGSEELDEETMKTMLESMKYKISVEFEKPVKKVTSIAVLTQEKNLVLLETNLSEIFNNSDYLKAIIKTK